MILLMLLLVLTIVRGTGGYLYVILLVEGRGGGVGGGGGEVLCPSFEQKDDAKNCCQCRGIHSHCAAMEISSFVVIIIQYLEFSESV